MIGARGYSSPPRSPLSPDYTPLRLPEFTQFNTEFLDGEVTDNGGSAGWSIPLKGGPGMSVTRPDDGWHAIGPPIDRDQVGALIEDLAEWDLRIGAHVVDDTGPFGAASDIDFVVGVVNVPVGGDTGISGVFVGLRYDGTTRVGYGWRLQRGIVSSATGVGNDLVRRWHTVMSGTWSSMNVARTWFLREDGTGVTAVSPIAVNHNDLDWLGVAPRPFVACFRTSTADPAPRTGVWQPVRSALVQHRNP